MHICEERGDIMHICDENCEAKYNPEAERLAAETRVGLRRKARRVLNRIKIFAVLGEGTLTLSQQDCQDIANGVDLI